MHHFTTDPSGWDWAWMIPMMLVWIAVLGGIVYAAVRLALHDRQKPPISR